MFQQLRVAYRLNKVIFAFGVGIILFSTLTFIIFLFLPGGKSEKYYDSRAGDRVRSMAPAIRNFPLRSTKQRIQQSSVGYNYWCKKRCHSTYEAADIGGQPDEDVLAVAAGEVLDVLQASVSQGKSSGATTRVRGEDGWWYYYAHLKAESISLKPGQKINAGEKIGLMGDSNDAQDRGAHLHLDISARENGFDRGANLCSEACTDLVAPQPLLHNLYEALPEK